jgi:hypothetical protein
LELHHTTLAQVTVPLGLLEAELLLVLEEQVLLESQLLKEVLEFQKLQLL